MLDIFLVEDEALIRMMIAEMVEELGHRVVAEAGSIEDARPIAESSRFDLAILDVSINGQLILPIVDVLERRKLPFLFATGYVSPALPEPFRCCPVLRKPFLIEQLGKAIETIFVRRYGENGSTFLRSAVGEQH
ncbi:CheY-like chemotaxis protein [Bradyrhizobium huanghuaihaiense]|uniref:Response regulator receiver domain-containing protein n=1 Tax=Bradyrhizobium huanghuaihaiense TaxID=990078 RepID=A0A562RHL3_9BRAD|nr:response regulator [Bradyrhizobium huanghuaihaiense]TWI67994.1 response regulator receiver domain-containing protein [Bradyrhizobium huanghuaihaiense]